MKGCSFTGHRPEKLKSTKVSIGDIIKALQYHIEKQIESGTTVFYTGMARGTDLWTAEIVLQKKKENTAIQLVSVIPFPKQADGWLAEEKKQYQRILEQSDGVVIICPSYQKNAYQRRNQYLVDHANSLIAVYNPQYPYSGTAQTIRMAEKAELRIIWIEL